MKIENNKSYALALSGGGARGSYQIGVWKRLIEKNIDIKAVCGTSIGAINGALIAQNDFDVAMNVWTNISPEEVFNMESGLVDRIRDISKLEKLIRDNIDEEKIRESDIDFGLVTFNITTREPVVIFKKDMPEGTMIDYILASANYPTFYRKKIDEEIYIDGGVYDNLPRKPLSDMGYKNIIEVDINPPLSNFTKKEVGDDVIVHTITSKYNLYGQLNFNMSHIKENLLKGYLDTKIYDDEYISSHYYVKKPVNDIDIALNSRDVIRLYNKLNFRKMMLNDTLLEKCIIFVNSYYKEKNGYEGENLSIRSEEFFVAALEITADVFGVYPIKEYSYEEFRMEVIKALFEIIKKEENIDEFIKNGFTSLKNISIDLDKKDLFAVLMTMSLRNKLMKKIIYKMSPKTIIAIITSFIVMNRMKFDYLTD